MLATEPNEPMLPIDSTDPREAIDSTESVDHSDSRDPPEPDAGARSCRDPPGSECVRHEGCPVPAPGLGQQMADVRLHRCFGNAQPVGDLGVARTVGDVPQHIDLAVGQPDIVRELATDGGDGGGCAGGQGLQQAPLDGGSSWAWPAATVVIAVWMSSAEASLVR